ncbi:MAG: redoxin domain-containing protein [Victivallaceae bacterium]|nr:redoxin domain-containing protein [Victivallaceae bacterium]
MKSGKITTAILLAMSSVAGFALSVGDPAPELQVSEWIKNGPATLAAGKGKNIYIVEFWHTACKPCLKVMPYFHSLQQQYRDKGLIIIGVSTEPADAVKNFIAKHPQLNYKIAVDDHLKTYNAYMSGNGNIPAAFIIDQSGTVAWIGNPLDIYLPLKRLFTGKFNLRAPSREQQVYREMQALLSRKDYAKALKVITAELQQTPDNLRFIALKAFVLFQLNRKDEALEFVSRMLIKHPADLELFELKVYILNQLKKYKELDEFRLAFVDACKDEPITLNQLARKLLGTRFGEARLKPALRAAELAYSNRKIDQLQRADIGATLARIYYLIGRIDRAIKIQNTVCRILKENKKAKYIHARRILEYYRQADELGR